MYADPFFWSCAIIAVLVTGISKGGFGGVAVLAVPLLSLSISPVMAAGLMLPIMLVMDVFSIWAWRKTWSKAYLLLMLPGALLGIVIGTLLAGWVNDDFVRIVIGLVAVAFSVYAILGTRRNRTLKKPGKPWAYAASLTAGFTSFVAHSGGPPYQAYMIPQALEKKIYTGTSVIFFAILNAVKIPPYAMLGQLSADNLMMSLLLVPLAPIGVWAGVWLNGKVPQNRFYQILYGLVLLVGIKLLFDGFTSVF